MESNDDLMVFDNPDFGQIRTFEMDGEPWLVGKDVAEALGYSDTAQAIRKHVDEEDKGVVDLTTPGGVQKITIINESGLYSLIFASKLPSAKKFKRWVTSEVLPSVCKYIDDKDRGHQNRDPYGGRQMTVDDEDKNTKPVDLTG